MFDVVGATWSTAGPLGSEHKFGTATRLPDGSVLASDVALSVKSNYFYVTIEARQGATRAHARALLRRGGGGKPTIVWQVVE